MTNYAHYACGSFTDALWGLDCKQKNTLIAWRMDNPDRIILFPQNRHFPILCISRAKSTIEPWHPTMDDVLATWEWNTDTIDHNRYQYILTDFVDRIFAEISMDRATGSENMPAEPPTKGAGNAAD